MADEEEEPTTPTVDPTEVDEEEISSEELEEVAEQVTPADEDGSPAAPEDEGGDAEQGIDELPGHVATVVVPLANPTTAADLLALGLAFCEYGGEVIGVTVTTDDAQAEAAADLAGQLEAAVEELRAAHPAHELELATRSATSVARGIVELAREENAGLIVLGVAPPTSDTPTDGPPLGRIAEDVIEVAPCDVVVLRPAHEDEHVEDLQRVVVAVDGGEPSRTAARSGIVLAEGLDLEVDVVHVQDHGRPRWDGLAVLARSLDGVDGRDRCRTHLLQGPDETGVLVASTGASDLLVVGLRRGGAGLRNWLFGSVASGLIREARGPVLVVARHVVSEGFSGRLERLRGWLQPSLTEVEQETLRWTARRQATTTIDYVTLLGVSAILATLGLVQDSVAVIIGAMLVAPLLGPLSAMSIGLVTARTSLLRRGTITLTIGTLAAMGLSLVVGWLLPLTEPTPQMLLRSEPSLLDVGIAVASGLVGAFATARKDIPAALAGVAIAAALVPPLSTVGLGVAFGDPSLAGGALLLFLVNIASVVVTGAVAFWWFGMRPVEQDHATGRQLTSAVLAAGLLFVVVTATVGLLEAQRLERDTRLDVQSRLTIGDDVEVVDVEVDPEEDRTVVTATVRSQRELTNDELRAAEHELTQSLDTDVDLRVVVLRVVSPS